MKFADYNPYNIEMYDHQRETATFVLRYKRCFIFDGLGSGKTISILSAADFLMIHNKIKRVLVVSPLSVMRATWATHILKHYPGRTFTVLHGTKAKRLANLKLDANFYLINSDGIKILEKEILAKKFDMVIIDESTVFSAHSSARTKCAWRICKKIPSVVCMTGNPIPNSPMQSYSQAKLINFDNPKYFVRFRDMMMIKHDMYTYLPRDNAVELAYSVLQPSIIHRTEDVIDLPPVTYEDRDIMLGNDQKKMYKMMSKEYLLFLESGETVSAANAAVRYIKLLQISCGIIINNEGVVTDINAKSRISELKLIYGQVDQLIVFASFTASIDSIMKEFPNAERIDGSVNGNKRFDIINRFQDKKVKMIVANPRALSHGVNLQTAQHIVWYSPTFSAETYEQANARIRRNGQLKPQFVIRFNSTPAEKKVYKALAGKSKISETFLSFTPEDCEI